MLHGIMNEQGNCFGSRDDISQKILFSDVFLLVIRHC